MFDREQRMRRVLAVSDVGLGIGISYRELSALMPLSRPICSKALQVPWVRMSGRPSGTGSNGRSIASKRRHRPVRSNRSIKCAAVTSRYKLKRQKDLLLGGGKSPSEG